MDKSKQPGISFDGIILVEEKFWRDYNVPEESKLDLDIQNTNQFTDNKAKVELISILKLINNDKVVLELISKFVGFFSIIEGNENMDLGEYMSNNTSPLMFPYVREHISAITAKAGIPPVLLPPINIIALIESKKQ